MVIFYMKWKKYNEIQLTKNKMDLNIRKMTNHPPSPVSYFKIQFKKPKTRWDNWYRIRQWGEGSPMNLPLKLRGSHTRKEQKVMIFVNAN